LCGGEKRDEGNGQGGSEAARDPHRRSVMPWAAGIRVARLRYADVCGTEVMT
jgi:hypothetical protein